MDEIVSAAEANRNISHILRGVREGRSYLVTSHGRPVARIVPVGDLEDRDASALEALMTHLRRQPVMNIGSWTRDELYEDDH